MTRTPETKLVVFKSLYKEKNKLKLRHLSIKN